MRRFSLPPALAFVLAAVSSFAAEPTPTFTNASVHDPSVIKVRNRFYVYGSHGASAWTEDLTNWTTVASGMQLGKVHFSNWKTTLADLFSWTQADTLWAADVYQLGDGKYYYYYNVWTNHLNYRSYLGLAVSDTIEGPYTNVGEILKGGTGIAGFDPAFDPNTIDPTLFRDPSNKLWMVYGSYSGGIFALEMDDTTGLQKPGQEWGVKLLDGRFGKIEGPFIEYNPDTGYFYLFLSFGGLNAADGYQMRVFRSQNPDGPYFDPKGTNMSTASSTTWTQNGLKLAGNWQFTPVAGEIAQSTTGYLSPGHNSIIQDPTTGKWFNFFHTRFVGRGEGHEIRIHQLFFNEDGWPVMAPHRYAGETQGSYSASEIAGSYKVINHGKDVPSTATAKPSTVIGLNVNGSLDNASGTWSMPDSQNIRITMDGISYKGAVCKQWDNENRLWVNTFTTISTDGTALWGSAVAVLDRSGELAPPQLQVISNTAIPGGEAFQLQLVNRSDASNLYLVYKLLENPVGMSIDADSGQIEWTPLATQEGVIHQVRARVYDAIDPSLADEVSFSIYVGEKVSIEGTTHAFTSVGSSGIKDTANVFTGLTARLPGTGTGYIAKDPNLTLDSANGNLLLKTTASDFNNQTGVAIASAVGRKLSEFGYTGSEDFIVSAEFDAISGLQFIDQVGLFVGSSASTLTRAGIIMANEASPAAQGLGVHTQSGTDTNATFRDSRFDLSDGLSVTIARQNGAWSYIVDGVSVSPTVPNATFLDSLSDLTVGVFAIHPLNTTVKTIRLKALSVLIVSDTPATTRLDEWKTTNFGENPALGIAGNMDNPDRDGLVNLLEYAIGSDPLRYTASPFKGMTVSEQAIQLQFQRSGDPALIYRVTANTDLTPSGTETIWSSAGESNEQGTAEVVDENAFETGNKRFFQLSVDTVE